MDSIRIGNPVAVKWAFKHTDGTMFPVGDYDIELFYYTSRGKTRVTDTAVIDVQGNLLVWNFNPEAQLATGAYSLTLKAYLDGNLVGSFDKKDAFMLTNYGIIYGYPIEVNLESKCDFIPLNDAILNAQQATHLAVEAANAIGIHGTSAQRPDLPTVGMLYFDTTLGKPIWWNGSFWVDATGTVLSNQ